MRKAFDSTSVAFAKAPQELLLNNAKYFDISFPGTALSRWERPKAASKPVFNFIV